MRAYRAAAAAALALALAGCSAGGGGATPDDVPPDPQPTAVDEDVVVETALIATATDDAVDVYVDPDSRQVLRRLDASEVVSLPGQIPLTFLVANQSEEWVQVHLPVRPNGSTGWLRGEDVVLTATDLRIEVSLGDRRLVLRDGGDVVMDVPVGIGKQDVPTPGGVYYVKELLQPPDPDGPYGAYAYGLSGFSPVLESFAGGEAVIGIHGTDDPGSIGEEVSHGCIRLHDDDVTRLVEEFGLPLGTPVEILA